MMGTEIFKIDASWAEKLTKTGVQFLLTPTVALTCSVGDYWDRKVAIDICLVVVNCPKQGKGTASG